MNTILGPVELIENAKYINNGHTTTVKINLNYKTNIPNIIVNQIINNWLKDRNNYLNEIIK